MDGMTPTMDRVPHTPSPQEKFLNKIYIKINKKRINKTKNNLFYNYKKLYILS